MSTVLITEFVDGGTKINWVHPDASGQLTIGTLIHPSGIAEEKTILEVECDTCNTKSFYPMSGGPIAQELHQHHLESDLLANVQIDATARGISTGEKDQDQLITEIIMDECDKQGVPYLLS